MTTEELENLRERLENEEEQHSEGRTEVQETRFDHNRWCKCRKCPPMSTDKESVCCRELDEAHSKIGDHSCITCNSSFERVCLDSEVLQTALVAMRDVRFEDYQNPIPQRTFRLAAYRQFTWWIHTRLGRSVRRIIPACVVTSIRQHYPEESGVHTEFQDPQETTLS